MLVTWEQATVHSLLTQAGLVVEFESSAQGPSTLHTSCTDNNVSFVGLVCISTTTTSSTTTSSSVEAVASFCECFTVHS